MFRHCAPLKRPPPPSSLKKAAPGSPLETQQITVPKNCCFLLKYAMSKSGGHDNVAL